MPRVEFDADRVQLATRIPSPLHHAIKLAAIDEEVSLRDWVADALETHLRRCQGRDGNESAPGRPPVTARKRTQGAA